jgi:enediyne biosynthesis protein E4
MIKLIPIVFCLAFFPCQLLSDEPECSIRFKDVTAPSNIGFRYENGGTDQYFLVETMGAGLALFDADCDGLIDVYMINGAALPGRTINPQPSDRFFRNRGGMKFQEETTNSQLTESNYGLGVTVGDFDKDGFQDLYISNFGPKVLMHNNGDGTFTDVTSVANVSDGNKFGAGVTFLDIDSDGDLDLFAGNYVNFDFDKHNKLAPNSHPYPPGPRDYPPAPDTLFLNNGDNTFSDISRKSGILNTSSPTMGVVAADFDKDGDTDIFAGCDGEPNVYYQNDGQGNFTEEALLVGVAYDARGGANGSMGVEVADVDGNGRLDIAVTNYMDQLMELFCGSSATGFDDVASNMKIGKSVKPHVNWGVSLVDLDLDGDPDAFICNGHFYKHAKTIEPITDYAVENCVMENVKHKFFRDVNAEVGSALQQKASSRGCAFDDLDNDGDIDGVVVNCDRPSQILQNDTENNNNWIQLKLVGTKSNRGAVGAKVKIVSGDKSQYVEQVNGRGYQSYYGSILNIGLGNQTSIDSIEVTWPLNAQPQILNNISPNQRLVVVEPAR